MPKVLSSDPKHKFIIAEKHLDLAKEIVCSGAYEAHRIRKVMDDLAYSLHDCFASVDSVDCTDLLAAAPTDNSDEISILRAEIAARNAEIAERNAEIARLRAELNQVPDCASLERENQKLLTQVAQKDRELSNCKQKVQQALMELQEENYQCKSVSIPLGGKEQPPNPNLNLKQVDHVDHVDHNGKSAEGAVATKEVISPEIRGRLEAAFRDEIKPESLMDDPIIKPILIENLSYLKNCPENEYTEYILLAIRRILKIPGLG